ncbi:MAG: ATP-binding cassette domain-containing protein [Acidobacteria bacterium]|nr:MAG: ATP-binding cassette domain-containing protein [Acidobacteriota bacterium]MCE7959912.1 ATP-binding cassette domain-containing protein [Acidobacteria bacterium ACB2]
MLDVQGLTKSFYGTLAVDDISFRVDSGEILGFLGPNGAGKTTTMRMITGFLPATAGRVVLDDVDVTQKPLEARRSLGYLPETLALYPEMRVREYIRFRAELCGVPGREVSSRVDEAIQKCFVDDVADTPIANLSKGYRQRTGLAGALVHKPKALVLDEPTVGLDPRQIVKVRELIRDLKKDHTILLSTHILPEVELVCDRVVIIDKGKILATGTPDLLRQQMAQSPGLTVALKGELTGADAAFKGIPGVVRAARIGAGGETRVVLDTEREADVREAVFREVVARGWTLLEMTPRQATLEDVFVRLVSQSAAAEPQTDELPAAVEAHDEPPAKEEAK